MIPGDIVRLKGEEAADWFDYWIDTYAHPKTSLFANMWERPGGLRAVIGAVEQGGDAHIYDIERQAI